MKTKHVWLKGHTGTFELVLSCESATNAMQISDALAYCIPSL